jgi:hypothetical protein
LFFFPNSHDEIVAAAPLEDVEEALLESIDAADVVLVAVEDDTTLEVDAALLAG